MAQRNYANIYPPRQYHNQAGRDQEPYNHSPARDPCGRGVMNVEVHMATGIKGDYLLGQRKSSPYVVLKYGHDKKELRSSMHRGGGSDPRWNEAFSYNIMNPAHTPPLIHLEIWNYHHTRKDNLLGRVSIENIQEYISRNPKGFTDHLWLPIFHVSSNGHGVEERGKILVRFHFESKSEAYYGDGLYRDDDTHKKGEKFADMTARGIEPEYTVVDRIPVGQVAGTVIRLI